MAIVTEGQDYIVYWRIRATRGRGYRSSGESIIQAENEEQAKSRLISKLYDSGMVDYPSAVEVTGIQLK